jgi:hypothetical protein
MARPDGSSASATAQQHVFQLPLMPELFHNQSCGHMQLDMLSPLLGRSRLDGQLVKVFSALLVRIVRDSTSHFVMAPADRISSMPVALGKQPWWDGRGLATLRMCSRDGHSGRLQWHWQWVNCRRATFVQFWVVDRSDNWPALAFGAKWVIVDGSE